MLNRLTISAGLCAALLAIGCSNDGKPRKTAKPGPAANQGNPNPGPVATPPATPGPVVPVTVGVDMLGAKAEWLAPQQDPSADWTKLMRFTAPITGNGMQPPNDILVVEAWDSQILSGGGIDLSDPNYADWDNCNLCFGVILGGSKNGAYLTPKSGTANYEFNSSVGNGWLEFTLQNAVFGLADQNPNDPTDEFMLVPNGFSVVLPSVTVARMNATRLW
jgi:hypothetical protein